MKKALEGLAGCAMHYIFSMSLKFVILTTNSLKKLKSVHRCIEFLTQLIKYLKYKSEDFSIEKRRPCWLKHFDLLEMHEFWD